MPPKNKKKNNRKSGKGAQKKGPPNPKEISDPVRDRAAHKEVIENKTVKDNLDEAMLLGEHEVFVIDKFKNNNEEKTTESPFESFISTLGLGDLEKGNNKSSYEVDGSVGNENESGFFDSTMNNSSYSTKNKTIVEKLDELDITSETETYGDLKSIDDYVALGVPRKIAEMKHPLEHSWSFWYFMNDKNRSWEQNQKKIAEVETIEDFWQVYNYIELASKLGGGCDYSVFKKGIMPDWEDFQNMSGGRWIINSDKSVRSQVVDHYWLETLLILIGEHAGEYAKMVNGAVINIRNTGKGDKVAVWLRNVSNLDGVMSIGRLVKSRLGVTTKMSFSMHREDSGRSRYSSQNSPSKIYI